MGNKGEDLYCRVFNSIKNVPIIWGFEECILISHYLICRYLGILKSQTGFSKIHILKGDNGDVVSVVVHTII